MGGRRLDGRHQGAPRPRASPGKVPARFSTPAASARPRRRSRAARCRRSDSGRPLSRGPPAAAPAGRGAPQPRARGPAAAPACLSSGGAGSRSPSPATSTNNSPEKCRRGARSEFPLTSAAAPPASHAGAFLLRLLLLSCLPACRRSPPSSNSPFAPRAGAEFAKSAHSLLGVAPLLRLWGGAAGRPCC